MILELHHPRLDLAHPIVLQSQGRCLRCKVIVGGLMRRCVLLRSIAGEVAALCARTLPECEEVEEVLQSLGVQCRDTAAAISSA